jgi:hypothetical protein
VSNLSKETNIELTFTPIQDIVPLTSATTICLSLSLHMIDTMGAENDRVFSMVHDYNQVNAKRTNRKFYADACHKQHDSIILNSTANECPLPTRLS